VTGGRALRNATTDSIIGVLIFGIVRLGYDPQLLAIGLSVAQRTGGASQVLAGRSTEEAASSSEESTPVSKRHAIIVAERNSSVG
jgi:hypothetical protein